MSTLAAFVIVVVVGSAVAFGFAWGYLAALDRTGVGGDPWKPSKRS